MNKLLKKIIWVIIAAPAIYLALIWNKLPEKIALHFNLQGTPDRYGSKGELLIYIPLLIGLNIALYLLLPLVYKIDPKKTAAANKPRLQKIAFATSIFLSFVTCFIVYNSANGGLKFNTRIIFGGIGLLWCIIGNYMYNMKPNYFAGFRISWTLNNEDIWRKTHHLGGIIFFTGGLLIFLLSLIVSQTMLIFVFVAVALLTTIIPGVYSYILYRKTKIIH